MTSPARLLCLVLLVLPRAAAAEEADPPELVEQYERGVSLFGEGQYAAAAYELEQVAARSQDPGRRAAAAELAETARARLAEPPLEEPPPPAEALPPGAYPPPPEEPLPPPTEVGPDGRMRLVWGSAVAGLYYGVALPIALGLEEPHHFTGMMLLTGGAGFLVPYLLTENTTVTHGMATLSLTGMGMGAVHGALLYALFVEPDADSLRPLVSAMLIGSLAEGIGGYLWARDANMGAGQASLIATGSMFGLAWGLGGAVLVIDDPDESDRRLWAGAALAGSLGGALGGKLLADSRSYTFGDAMVLSTGGLVGTYLGTLPPVLLESDSPRFLVGSLMVGSALGLVLGDRLVANKDYEWSQAQYVTLGFWGGSLMGAGLGLLVSGKEVSGKAVLTSSALGGGLGYVLFATTIRAPPDGTAPEWAGRVVPTPWAGEHGARGLGLAGFF